MTPHSSLGSPQESKIEHDLAVILSRDMTQTEFNEWLSIDHDSDVTQALSDDEIITEIQNSTQKHGDDSDDKIDGKVNEPKPISKQQTMNALKTLRRALGQSGGSDEYFDSLYHFQNFFSHFYLANKKQTKIDNIFSMIYVYNISNVLLYH